MWVIIIVLAGLFLLVGIGRSIYKGQYDSLRDFLLTMFFLDVMFDDWDADSDVTDVDF